MSLKTWKQSARLFAIGICLACMLKALASTVEDTSAAPATARQVLALAGVKGGLVVHLGCGDGRLTAALRAGEAFVVHGLDADAGRVAAARRNIQAMGCYGPVSIEQWAA